MRVTTWTEYSLIITLHLARRAGESEGPISARELAEIERLPADYTEQILLRLRRAGLVTSVRGAKGGYFLNKAPGTISVRDVMTACERQTFEMNCQTHQVDSDRCHPSNACSIRPVWAELRQRVDSFLSGITLADLLQREPRVQELVTISSD